MKTEIDDPILETRYPIPLGVLDTSDRESELLSGRESRTSESRPTTRDLSYRDTIDHGRYSSRCTYHKISYYARIVSYGQISQSGHKLHFAIDTGHGINHGIRTGELRAPRGWRWANTENGLCIQLGSQSDTDYHPTACEILESGYTGADMARFARTNAKIRRDNARAAASLVRAIKRDDPLVMVQDSLRAGNCAVGTLAFADRAGVRADRYYSAIRSSRLRRLAGESDSGRVDSAIRAAYQRETLVAI